MGDAIKSIWSIRPSLGISGTDLPAGRRVRTLSTDRKGEKLSPSHLGGETFGFELKAAAGWPF